ncbi:uncharacterized protein MONBRDRAFT_3788, partial [Monosiga brevicollis MX1]
SAAQRKACWAARDEYQQCLEKNGEGATQCEDLRKSFVAACPEAWVKHFERRRIYARFKQRL